LTFTLIADRPVLAVDLGGTKLAAAIVTPQGELAQPISARSIQVKVSTLGVRAGLLGAAYAARLRLSSHQV